MARPKNKIEKRTKALELHLNHFLFEEIAKRLNVSTRQIYLWAEVDKWQEIKDRAFQEAQQNIFYKFRDQAEKFTGFAFQGSLILAKLATDELTFIFNESEKVKPFQQKSKEEMENIRGWGNVLKLATEVFKGSMPKADEQTSKKIADSLEKLAGKNNVKAVI